MPTHVELHRDPAAFDRLAQEWSALLRRAAVDTPFLTPVYARTWWRHLGEGELALITVRENGELAGLAPLFVAERADGGRVVQTVGCVEVSDYLDLIAVRGREEASYEAVLDLLGGPAAPAWDMLDLCNIRRDSPTLRILPRLARARGWMVEMEVQEVCPVVSLPATWEEYVASLDKKHRHELRRKMRRAAAAEGLRWYIVAKGQDLEAEVEDLMALMVAGGPEKSAFLTPPMRAFFRELARVTFDAGWLQLSFLRVAERKLAAYFSFVYNDRVWVYNSGLDWRNDPGFGAGIVLTGYLIRHAIEQGWSEYDFMRGGERYKYRFGGVDVTVHRLVVKREE